MFKIGDQVSKVNVGGQTGSARVYEIAQVIIVAELSEWGRIGWEDETVLYAVRKVGGKGKGGCYYKPSQLVAAN